MFKKADFSVVGVTEVTIANAIAADPSGVKNEVALTTEWEKNITGGKTELVSAACVAAFRGASSRARKIGNVPMETIGGVSNLLRCYIGEVVATAFNLGGANVNLNGTAFGDVPEVDIQKAIKWMKTQGQQVAMYDEVHLTERQRFCLFQGANFLITKSASMCEYAAVAQFWRAKCDLATGVAMKDVSKLMQGTAQLSKTNNLMKKIADPNAVSRIILAVKALPAGKNVGGGGAVSTVDMGFSADINQLIAVAQKFLNLNKGANGKARIGQDKIVNEEQVRMLFGGQQQNVNIPQGAQVTYVSGGVPYTSMNTEQRRTNINEQLTGLSYNM